jgi:hypothetical protein
LKRTRNDSHRLFDAYFTSVSVLIGQLDRLTFFADFFRLSVAGISSSEDEDAGDAEDEEDTGSTVSVSQLSEEDLRKRIATVKSMIEVANKELFQYCYDLINFTPKVGNSKKAQSFSKKLRNSRFLLTPPALNMPQH